MGEPARELLPLGDPWRLTAALVNVASESFAESELADAVEALLHTGSHLSVDRVGDNVIARTTQGRSRRLVLGGHIDTVAVNDNAGARIDGDRMYGVGTTDMKSGIAVMLEVAMACAEPPIDVTYVFYAREEVAVIHNGLREIDSERPDLLLGDVALLGEPTNGALEAGCQGTLRVQVTMKGDRAHTARAWMGVNAIHRLGALLALVAAYEPRRPVVEGCTYHEALQAVEVGGGVSGNVVPDRASVLINHRFAPDRSPEAAEAHVREYLSPALGPDDEVVLTDCSPAARPGLDDPLLQSLIERNGLEVRAKLGWTDVAFFSQRGVPASNFGPGDPTIAHTQGEYVEKANLHATYLAVLDLVNNGA